MSDKPTEQSAINHSSYLMVFLASSTIFFIVYLIIQFPYIASDFIYGLDDNIYVPQALFGRLTIIYQLPYPLMILVGALGSVALLKIVVLMFLAACAGLIAILFARYVHPWLAVLFGITAISFPTDISQVVFLSGTHPFFALLFTVSALILFQYALKLSGRHFILANIGVMILLLETIVGSPLGRIIPFAYPLWFAAAWINARKDGENTRPWATTFGITAVIGIIGYVLLGIIGHHYSSLVGWTDISVGRILENLGLAIQHLSSSTIGSSGTLPLIVYSVPIVLILLTIAYAWRRRSVEATALKRDSMSLIVLGVNALVVSALAFAPTAVVVGYRDRYLTLPWVLLLIAVFAFACSLLPTLRNKYKTGLMLSFAILIAGNFILLQRATQLQFPPLLESHNAYVAFGEAEKNHFSSDAQIVLIVDGKYLSTTGGYNHWSSWYLRYLTKNPDVIGLIGKSSMITRSPFIDHYVDHDDQFWTVVDDVSKRTSMIGLEYDRPTYVYEVRDGELQPVDYLIVTDGQITRTIGYGQSFDGSEANTLQAICQENAEARFFVWEANASSSQLCQS